MHYIDDVEYVHWSGSESWDEYETDDGDSFSEAEFEDNRVEDEDWDITERGDSFSVILRFQITSMQTGFNYDYRLYEAI